MNHRKGFGEWQAKYFCTFHFFFCLDLQVPSRKYENISIISLTYENSKFHVPIPFIFPVFLGLLVLLVIIFTVNVYKTENRTE